MIKKRIGDVRGVENGVRFIVAKIDAAVRRATAYVKAVNIGGEDIAPALPHWRRKALNGGA